MTHYPRLTPQPKRPASRGQTGVAADYGRPSRPWTAPTVASGRPRRERARLPAMRCALAAAGGPVGARLRTLRPASPTASRLRAAPLPAWVRAPARRTARTAADVSAADWPTLAPAIAAALERGPLADRPRRELREHGGTTVRYGSRGSLRLTLTGPNAGTWRDHEAGAAGGVLALLLHVGAAADRRDAVEWLRRHGVGPPESPYRPTNGATPAPNYAARR